MYNIRGYITRLFPDEYQFIYLCMDPSFSLLNSFWILFVVPDENLSKNTSWLNHGFSSTVCSWSRLYLSTLYIYLSLQPSLTIHKRRVLILEFGDIFRFILFGDPVMSLQKLCNFRALQDERIYFLYPVTNWRTNRSLDFLFYYSL